MLLGRGSRRAATFGSGLGPVIDIAFGHGGNDKALYYTTWNVEGQLLVRAPRC